MMFQLNKYVSCELNGLQENNYFELYTGSRSIQLNFIWKHTFITGHCDFKVKQFINFLNDVRQSDRGKFTNLLDIKELV